MGPNCPYAIYISEFLAGRLGAGVRMARRSVVLGLGGDGAGRSSPRTPLAIWLCIVGPHATRRHMIFFSTSVVFVCLFAGVWRATL